MIATDANNPATDHLAAAVLRDLNVTRRDVESLVPYARNARKHSVAQINQLASTIRELGWTNPVLIDPEGGIIAGHGRVLAAKQLGLQQVPCIEIGDLTKPQIRALILADNRLAEMADWDMDLLGIELAELRPQLTKLDITGFTEIDLENILGDDKSAANKKAAQADPNAALDESQIYALRESAIMPSSNRFGIPDLRPDMLASTIPTKVWGGGPFPPKETVDDYLFVHTTAGFEHGLGGGTLAFYVDDWRFEAVWFEAVKTIEKFRRSGFSACITPDFSVWQDTPVAIRIFNIYRARWVARYWQEVGMKVIPSLAWGEDESMEFCNLGIPKGAPVVSFQCRTTKGRRNKTDFIKNFDQTLEAIQPQTILIYGGQENRHWVEPILPSGPHYVFLSSWGNERQIKRKEK